jgi:hypothetical protein
MAPSMCTPSQLTGRTPGSAPQDVIGVAKAYTTRVGSGPYPTELFGDHAEEIRAKGGEYGTTTGRPRRCGWLDMVALNYALEVNPPEKLSISAGAHTRGAGAGGARALRPRRLSFVSCSPQHPTGVAHHRKLTFPHERVSVAEHTVGVWSVCECV